MKLLFIRHGDPDYVHDTVTEKGRREIELLADYLAPMPIRDFYVSPLGRAQDTAKATLRRIGRQAETCGWLEEFPGRVVDETTGKKTIPWDFLPDIWTKKPEYYDKDGWYDEALMRTGEIKESYRKICGGIDGLLSRYGYDRDGSLYRTEGGNTDTIALFCHLGVQFSILSHLLGIPAVLLWHSFYVAPTSITTVISEERVPGRVFFRCAALGETTHLKLGGEPVSCAGLHEEIPGVRPVLPGSVPER